MTEDSTSTGAALTHEKIKNKLDEFAQENEITDELIDFYRSVVEGTMSVQQLKKGTREQPDELIDVGPTIHERISAGKALASLAVRRPGTKLPPPPDVEQRKRTADDVIEELERRFERAKSLQQKSITGGGIVGER